MEKAYALLGIHDLATESEIEEAYRSKKRLYDLSRFVEGSLDWQFARARNEALDEAYRYAKNAGTAARRASPRPGQEDGGDEEYEDWDVPASPFGELVGLVIVCPIAIYVMKLMAPTMFYELAPKTFRGTVWLLDIIVLLLGYFSPLLMRFVFFRRPVANFAGVLLLFPLTLFFADLVTTVILRFSILPRSRAVYIPAFYLLGLGPLFILLHSHCTILGTGSPEDLKESAPLLRRLTAHTFTLVLSVALSMVLCTALNREKTPLAFETSAPLRQEEERWRILKLTDAGVLEIPGAWDVEDSNGKLTRTQHERAVQYVREVLTASPYGRRSIGLDYAFELLAYWWTNLNGNMLSPSPGIVDRIQDNQFDFIKQEYPEISFHAKNVIELEGRSFSVLTVETNSVRGFIVRFKNIVLEHEGKVYAFTVSYPANEEDAWSETLDQILSRWRLE